MCLTMFTNLYAQNTPKTTNNQFQYKVILQDIDQYQLKKLLPICNDVFQSNGNIKGDEIHIIYFESSVDVTSDLLKKELLDNNYTFNFTLLVMNEKTHNYEKK